MEFIHPIKSGGRFQQMALNRALSLSLVRMSKLRPIAKVCLVKSQSLDYLANKVSMNLLLLKVLIGLPGLTAQPLNTSSTAKQQRCKFLLASLKKGKGVFFVRRGVYLVSRELFCQGEGLFLQQG